MLFLINICKSFINRTCRTFKKALLITNFIVAYFLKCTKTTRCTLLAFDPVMRKIAQRIGITILE